MNHKLSKETVGNRIRGVRLEQGLTQKGMGQVIAERTNEVAISLKLVSRWERGTSTPSPARLKAIADIGGLTVGELITGEGQSVSERVFDQIREAKRKVKTDEWTAQLALNYIFQAAERHEKKPPGRYKEQGLIDTYHGGTNPND